MILLYYFLALLWLFSGAYIWCRLREDFPDDDTPLVANLYLVSFAPLAVLILWLHDFGEWVSRREGKP